MVDSGTTEIRAICPFCVHPNAKFYVNETKDVYQCFHCKAKGKASELEQAEVVEVERIPPKMFNRASVDLLEPLASDPLGRFRSSNLEPFKESLAWCPTRKAMAFISRDQDGNPIGLKYRLTDPASSVRYMAEPGSVIGSFLVGTDYGLSKLLITEGEIDAISAVLVGFKGQVLALQSANLKADMVPFVSSFKEVWLALDNDEAGTEASLKIKETLGSRVKLLGFPKEFKDLNDVYLSGDLESVIKMTRSEVERSTVTLKDRLLQMAAYLKDKDAIDGISTGFPMVDRVFGGGLRPGELTVLNGFFKRGKTTVLMNLTYRMLQLKTKVAVSSFEMDTDTQILPNLLSLALGEDILNYPVSAVDVALNAAVKNFPEFDNLTMFHNYGHTTITKIEDWIRYVASQDAEVIIIDHKDFLCERPGDADENEKVASKLAQLAKELKVHIMVAVQAPKPPKDRQGYNTDLSGLTAHGGTAWAKQCSNYLTLKVDFEKHITILEMGESGRNRRVIRGEPVWLHYDPITGSLSETVRD